MLDVLVVDDDAIVRSSISHTLTYAGYRVATAGDGKVAFDLLKAGRHQLVVSDWSMPGMDGIDLCRAVRTEGLRGYIYFILLTSHNRSEDAIEGLSAGADDYIVKPFNPGELIMRVNTGRRIVGLETRDMAIFSMAKLAESRDPETGAHLERVRSYSRVLAQQLRDQTPSDAELDDEYVRLIFETSPLHDIGKVAIPDSILLKQGKHTDHEFEVMKTHTLRGAETLCAAIAEFPRASFLRMAHDIALFHHERFDGRGYPHGLAGNSIPLCARIVSVADVYDALTSKRVYKDAYSHDVAKSILVCEAGQQFDPQVVDAFLAQESAFVEIHARHQDRAELARTLPRSNGSTDVPGTTARTGFRTQCTSQPAGVEIL